MPELPEVETIRRQLEPDLVGRTFASVEVLDPYFVRPSSVAAFEREVTGRDVHDVGRRGKYLLFELDDGRTVVIHLRMTGSLVLLEPDGTINPGDPRVEVGDPGIGAGGPGTGQAGDGSGPAGFGSGQAGSRPGQAGFGPADRHLKARFLLDDGGELRFSDPRRFGRGFIAGPAALDEYFEARLGVEPLSPEFTVEAMAAMTANRTGPLKSFLLNQKGVAGVGNIYADEALFRAGLHPLSPGGSMRVEHHKALRDGVVESLERGLDLGGASIDDYRDARGDAGAMQKELLVHRREGEDCPRCGQTIVRTVVGGRSTYFCPGCQKRLRKRPRRRAR